MPEKNELIRVGRVKDGHGIKGELFIILFSGEAAWLKQLKELYLVDDLKMQAPKIFQIKSVRLHKKGLIVKTPEISTRNEAEALKGLFLEIPASFMVSEAGEEIYLREVHGFRVFDAKKGEIGTVTGFTSNGVQDLLIIHTSWGDFDIPFVEAFVESIDFEARLMHLDIPEGLLGEDIDAGTGSDHDDHSSVEDEEASDQDDDQR
jgi:16S rRNA processing protein RimM